MGATNGDEVAGAEIVSDLDLVFDRPLHGAAELAGPHPASSSVSVIMNEPPAALPRLSRSSFLGGLDVDL
jgi:hypothetical protein